jgi:hypothetical protein
MAILEDRNLRDALRQVLHNASEEGYLTPEESKFTNKIFKKIDGEIERKTKTLHQLEGEIHQLRLTKRLIIDMIRDSVAAQERARARDETAERLRSGRAARETVVIEEPIVEEKAPKKARRKRTTKKKEDKK